MIPTWADKILRTGWEITSDARWEITSDASVAPRPNRLSSALYGPSRLLPASFLLLLLLGCAAPERIPLAAIGSLDHTGPGLEGRRIIVETPDATFRGRLLTWDGNGQKLALLKTPDGFEGGDTLIVPFAQLRSVSFPKDEINSRRMVLAVGIPTLAILFTWGFLTHWQGSD